MQGSKIWGVSLIAICLLLAAISPAQAQKYTLSVAMEADGGLKVVAVFSDGSPAPDVSVKVIATNGEYVARGRTNAQGSCKLEPLAPGEYQLEAGDPLGDLARLKLIIPAAAAPPQLAPLKAAAPSAARAQAASPPASPRRLFPWVDILAVLGCIFGVSAFILVLKLRLEVKLLSRN